MKYSILFLLAFAVIGCKNPCKDIDCGAQGVCNEGVCDCNVGYETDGEGRCNTETRAKFLGTYSCNETCGTIQDAYFCTIATASGSVNQITISNIYGFANNVVTASVSADTVTIASQTTPDNFRIEGSGVLSNTTILLGYRITRLSDNATDTCTLQMLKQ